MKCIVCEDYKPHVTHRLVWVNDDCGSVVICAPCFESRPTVVSKDRDEWWYSIMEKKGVAVE